MSTDLFPSDFENCRILVTGHDGFLGRHLCSLLRGLGVREVWGFADDLMDYGRTLRCLDAASPDYVFHLAGFNGGIQFNLDRPAEIFTKNTIMGMNLLEAARRAGAKKVVSVVASCAYPAEIPWIGWEGDMEMRSREVMLESDFLDGPPHDSVACHGYAKRNLQLASGFYRKQYGLNAVCACPTTLYGPGDSYDPMRTKVMGAMVKRFVDAVGAGEREVVCWGSGRPLREFLYVEDACWLLLYTLLKYDDSDAPLNLGSGQELSIREVAEAVARAVEFRGNIRFDETKPDGQLRKRLDTSKMRDVIGHFEFTPLDEGVAKSVADYRSRKKVAA